MAIYYRDTYCTKDLEHETISCMVLQYTAIHPNNCSPFPRLSLLSLSYKVFVDGQVPIILYLSITLTIDSRREGYWKQLICIAHGNSEQMP